jgi:hypothetical protein
MPRQHLANMPERLAMRLAGSAQKRRARPVGSLMTMKMGRIARRLRMGVADMQREFAGIAKNVRG